MIFKLVKLIKKSQKGLYFAHIHVDATWHSGPHGSAHVDSTRAPAWRRGDKWRIYINYIYIYIMYIGLSIIGRHFINP